MENNKYLIPPPKLKEPIEVLEKKIPNLQKWEVSQMKAFTGLINGILAVRKIKITNLASDLRTGFALYHALDVLTPLKFRLPKKETKTIFDCYDNMSVILSKLKSDDKNFLLNESALVEGEEIKNYLGIMWHIILHYHLARLSSNEEEDPNNNENNKGKGKPKEKEALKNLLEWCNGHVPETMHLKNFTKDFQDGKAFAYILESISNKSVTFEELIKEDSTASQNLETVFSAAEKECKISPILDAEVFAESPDKESNVAYLSLFKAYEKFKENKEEKLTSIKLELGSARRSLARAKEKNYQTEKELAEMKAKMDQEKRNQIKLMNEEALKKNELLRKELEELRAELNAEKAARKAIQESVDNYKNEIASNNETINRYKRVKDELKRECSALRDEFERKNEEQRVLNDINALMDNLRMIPLRAPKESDFAEITFEEPDSQFRESTKKQAKNKWPCKNCGYRNTKEEVLCRNCFFIMDDYNLKRKKKVIEESDFFKKTIYLEDPLSYDSTYIFYVKKSKHIFKLAHDPVTEARKLVLDGNVLHIKKKGLFSNPSATYEFYCSDLPCVFQISTQKVDGGEVAYVYNLKIDGKSFEEYKKEYFHLK